MNLTSSPQVQNSEAIDAAYCRAALYSALAIGFQSPTGESLARLLTPESRHSLKCAADVLYPARQPDLISLIDAFPDGAAHAHAMTLSARYHGLFGHAAGGPVPPYETEYGNEALFQQPQELGDLMGFYRTFGLQLKADKHERPDHVSCECEFLMFLALKEAYALEHDAPEMLADTRRAQQLFLRDHLARFFPAFAARLNREDEPGFYGILAELGARLLTAECARLEIPSGSANLGLRPADDARVPMACGAGTECTSMPGVCLPDGSEPA